VRVETWRPARPRRRRGSGTSRCVAPRIAEARDLALLSDWPDSKIEIDAADTEILEYARAEIARLNARYPSEGAPRFYILHRRRLFNAAQNIQLITGEARLENVDVAVVSKVSVAVSSCSQYMH